MSDEPVSPDPELAAMEAALAALAPARSRVDRDRVMFAAGRAAARARTGRGVWMALAASFGIVALAEAAFIARRPAVVTERVVVITTPGGPVPRTAPTDSAADRPGVTAEALPPLARTDYERLSDQILRYGLDGLPDPPPAALVHSERRPAPTWEQLREEFREVLDPGDPS
jgi:hypothetical protein